MRECPNFNLEWRKEGERDRGVNDRVSLESNEERREMESEREGENLKRGKKG